MARGGGRVAGGGGGGGRSSSGGGRSGGGSHKPSGGGGHKPSGGGYKPKPSGGGHKPKPSGGGHKPKVNKPSVQYDHHDHDHDQDHVSVHVHSLGEANPKVVGVMFAILGVVFFLLAIIVPSSINSKTQYLCHPALSVNKREQQFCNPRLLDKKYKAEVTSDKKYEPDKYVKIYRTTESQLKNTTRHMSYKDYTETLSRWYTDFSMSISAGVVMNVSANCKGLCCSYTRMYWLTDDEFLDHLDENEDFLSKTDYIMSDFSDYDFESDSFNTTVTAYGNNYMHLIFSVMDFGYTTIKYSVDIDYIVYDVSDLNAEKCESDCKFKDLATDDVIILDFADDNLKGPDYLNASIYAEDVDYTTPLSCGLIFGVIAIICFLIAALYLYKLLKKLGKIGKKAFKKVEKEQEKREAEAAATAAATPATPTPAVAPAPAQPGAPPGYVDPNYPPQQPYADPNYGQPYPAQPYPGQPVAQPADPNYPGQDAPGQMV